MLLFQIALTHIKLLQQWRDRAISGQTEARRVLAEMLTPSGGARSNCYKFISWVTGCSHSTIGRVNEQMKETGWLWNFVVFSCARLAQLVRPRVG